MRLRNVFAALAVLGVATAAPAQTANIWRVSGSISGRHFNMDCRLDSPAGSCTELPAANKIQRLASFGQSGNQVNWSLKTRVVLMNITVAFNGQINGDRMSGTMTAAGRAGTFTAVRR